MTTLLIIAALFCVYKIITSAKAHRAEQEREEAEYRRQAEAQRMRNEWRNVQAEAKVAIMKQEAMWKEQERLRKQAEREREELRKEQERQAKEQERQAAILEKHEEMLRKHEFQLRQAKRDIDFLKERLGQQEAQRDYLLLQQEGMIPGSKEHDAIQRKIVVLDNQIHSTVSRYNRAVFNAKEAEKKLA